MLLGSNLIAWNFTDLVYLANSLSLYMIPFDSYDVGEFRLVFL